MAHADEKVQVEILRGVVGEGGEDWAIGSVQTASAPFARWLIDRGKAKRVEAPAAEPSEPDPTPAAEPAKPARGKRGG